MGVIGSLTELLVDAGAEVNAQDNDGRTALMLSCASFWQTMESLMDADADVNAQDNDGRTALMYYIQYVEWPGTPQADRFNTEAIIDKKDNKGRKNFSYSIFSISKVYFCTSIE